MKKTIRREKDLKRVIFIFALLLCMLSLSFSVCAQEQNVTITDTQSDILDNTEALYTDFKYYIGEKIIPTLVGVVAGLIGLFGSVGVVKRAISSLRTASSELTEGTKSRQEKLDSERQELIFQIDALRDYAGEISQLKSEFEGLKNELGVLIKESHNVSRMVVLNTLGDDKAMRDGRGAKIYKLLEKSNQLLEQIGIKTDTYGRILDDCEETSGEEV